MTSDGKGTFRDALVPVVIVAIALYLFIVAIGAGIKTVQMLFEP